MHVIWWLSCYVGGTSVCSDAARCCSLLRVMPGALRWSRRYARRILKAPCAPGTSAFLGRSPTSPAAMQDSLLLNVQHGMWLILPSYIGRRWSNSFAPGSRWLSSSAVMLCTPTRSNRESDTPAGCPLCATPFFRVPTPPNHQRGPIITRALRREKQQNETTTTQARSKDGSDAIVAPGERRR